MFVISFSAEINDLSNNNLFNPQIASKFPGASWPLEVKKILTDHVCVTADVALNMIVNNQVSPKNVLVIQHNTDKISNRLITLGAVPFFLTNFESPLYAPKFYKTLDEAEKKFHYSLIFCSLKNETNKRHAIRFPSFSIEKINCIPPIPWQERKFACIVMGNKYVPLQNFIEQTNLLDFFWLLIMKLKKFLKSPTEPVPYELKSNQLQDKRLEVIIHFLKKNIIDLYGKNWDVLWSIPPKYSSILKIILLDKLITAPVNKNETIKNYKFNLCFENVSYPGYVTEKILDSILAKTIPVYLGSDDVTDFIPADIFIDASKFESYDALSNFMQKIDQKDAERIIKLGQAFLNSEAGRQYSYEENAKFISKKINAFSEELKAN